MVHRDPETGRFVAGHGLSPSDFDDTEVANWQAIIDVGPGTTTGTQGELQVPTETLYSLDELLDRDEEGVLLRASHQVQGNFTDLDATAPTEVGRLAAWVEISTSGVLQIDPGFADTGATNRIVTRFDDSLDVIGRPLYTEYSQVFRDAVDAVGGGAALGRDTWDGMPADPNFFARDEVLCNASVFIDNIDDPGITVVVAGQHIYGVREA